MMYQTVTVTAALHESKVKVSPSVVNVIRTTDYDAYDGAVEFTPSTEEQVVPTMNKVLNENIVINPIPSNYGLIAWNGAYLTVS